MCMEAFASNFSAVASFIARAGKGDTSDTSAVYYFKAGFTKENENLHSTAAGHQMEMGRSVKSTFRSKSLNGGLPETPMAIPSKMEWKQRAKIRRMASPNVALWSKVAFTAY
jgi:hypothetical protein